MTDQTQEARVLRHLMTGRSVDRGDGANMGILELHMRCKHISEAYEFYIGIPDSSPINDIHGEEWRYFPIRNEGVTKNGPRKVWHPDKARHVSYAIYRLPLEHREAMRQVGVWQGWIPDSTPVVIADPSGQLVIS